MSLLKKVPTDIIIHVVQGYAQSHTYMGCSLFYKGSLADTTKVVLEVDEAFDGAGTVIVKCWETPQSLFSSARFDCFERSVAQTFLTCKKF